MYSTYEIADIQKIQYLLGKRTQLLQDKIYEPPNLFSIAGIGLTRPAIYLQGFPTECCVLLMDYFPLSVTVCPSYCEDLYCSLNGLFLNPALRLTVCVLFTDTTNNVTFESLARCIVQSRDNNRRAAQLFGRLLLL
jgi:hypothetical protein